MINRGRHTNETVNPQESGVLDAKVEEEDEKMTRKSIHGIEANSLTERKDPGETPFFESETPVAFLNMHLFEQIDAKGQFRSKEMTQMDSRIDASKLKDLFVTITLTDILNVDPVSESFSIKYRSFLFWEQDLHEIGLAEIAEKAQSCGHYYPLSRVEVDQFAETVHLPKLMIFNQASVTETDVLDIRIYGGERGKTAVMTNQSFIAVCRGRFALQQFPFDLQTLVFDFRLNDARSWNTYYLTIAVVQLHKDCLEQLEWQVLVPCVKRGYPKSASSIVTIPVQRKSQYYLQNILLIVLILTSLGLSTFAFPSDDLTGRTFCVFTLILTCIAFKFTAIAESLPKVPYATVLDHFMSSSIWILAFMTIFCLLPNFYIDEAHTDETLNLAFTLISIGMIVLAFGGLALKSYWIWRSHFQSHDTIPTDLDRPWYSFRYSNPRFLVDVDVTIPFSDSMKSHSNSARMKKNQNKQSSQQQGK